MIEFLKNMWKDSFFEALWDTSKFLFILFIGAMMPFITFLLFLVFCCVMNVSGGYKEKYSEGEWVGSITKISEKGVFYKSNEGVIILGDKYSTVIEEFNVPYDKELIAQIKNAIDSKQTVKLYYTEWFVRPIKIDNCHVVNKIEFLKLKE